MTKDKVPKSVFRLYGVNKSGNSIVAHVHGFHPYIFVEAPKDFRDVDRGIFRNALNDTLKQKAPQHRQIDDLVLKVDICMKTSQFVKILNLLMI